MGLDSLQHWPCLAQEMLVELPARQNLVRQGVEAGKTVVEETHLAFYAAYASVSDETTFLQTFQDLENKIIWPDIFLRLEAPLEVLLFRQSACAESSSILLKGTISAVTARLSAWHVRRADRVERINADQPPHELVAAIVRLLNLRSRTFLAHEVLPYLFPGRPAAGKSELIQFLSYLPLWERACAYHLGMHWVLDDFQFLWEKFTEDDIWETLGFGRLHSRRFQENYAVVNPHLWDFSIQRLIREL